jgi:hypothetical protein
MYPEDTGESVYSHVQIWLATILAVLTDVERIQQARLYVSIPFRTLSKYPNNASVVLSLVVKAPTIPKIFSSGFFACSC